MKHMPAGKFKAQCLAVMDRVNHSGETVVITKRGKPVARLVPADTKRNDVFGYMVGKVRVVGDIVAPAIAIRDWKLK